MVNTGSMPTSKPENGKKNRRKVKKAEHATRQNNSETAGGMPNYISTDAYVHLSLGIRVQK